MFNNALNTNNLLQNHSTNNNLNNISGSNDKHHTINANLNINNNYYSNGSNFSSYGTNLLFGNQNHSSRGLSSVPFDAVSSHTPAGGINNNFEGGDKNN
jgi:hypothetical protein